MCSFCRRGGAGPVGAASARCCGRDARAFLSLRVGDVSERIDCGTRCLCRSSVAMSRAGKWRLNRRSLFPRNFRKPVRKLRYTASSEEKEERGNGELAGAFWNLWFFLFPHAVSCLFWKNFQACSGRTFTVVQIFEPLQANQETIRNFMRSRNLMRADMRKIADSNSPQKSAEVCLSDAPAKRYSILT